MPPNKGILFNGVLTRKLPSIPLTSYFFLINFDSLVPHIAPFNDIIVLSLLVLELLDLCFLYVFYTLKNKITLFY